MKFRLLLIIAVLMVSACQTAPKYSREDLQRIADEYGDNTVVGNGLTVREVLDMDMQRRIQAEEMFEILSSEETFEVTPSISPLRYPTVSMIYTGQPPGEILDSNEELRVFREDRKIIDDLIIYDSDMALMTMVLEKKNEDESYEYHELESSVPYGLCLDFIAENLGEESDTLDGFILVKIVCSQDDLGIEY